MTTPNKNNRKKDTRRQSYLIGSGGDEFRSTTLSIVTNNSSQFTSTLNLRSNGINQNDAYLVSRGIKVFFNFFKLIFQLNLLIYL